MFWQKTTAPESETLRRAREALAEGGLGEAIGLLTTAFEENPEDRAAYALAAEVLTAADAPAEAALFRTALDSHPLQALFDLGMHFSQAGHAALTQAFLGRVYELSRHPIAAVKLAQAKRDLNQIAAAAELLRGAEGSLPFSVQAELARTELLLGQPDTARQLAHEYASLSAEEQAEYTDAAEQVADMLRRFEAIGTPAPQVRDWHFIQYGGAILSFFGEDDPEELAVAGGRYVYLALPEEAVAQVLWRLKDLLKRLDKQPAQVWAAPDKDSQVLGHALALLLEVPLVTGERPLENVLVVAAEHHDLLQSKGDVSELERVRSGQITFTFNLNWVEAGGMAPDVAGLLTQVFRFPWTGDNLRVNLDDPENPQVETTEASGADAQSIAAELVKLDTASDTAFRETLDFYAGVQSELTLNRVGARRWPFLRESPVPGSFFGPHLG